MRTQLVYVCRDVPIRPALLCVALSLLAVLPYHVGASNAQPTPAGSDAMWVPWGDPEYTLGNDCRSPWPAWGVAAFKLGGEWRYDLPAWSATPGEPGALCLELDRDALQHDLTLLLWYTGSPAVVDLYDAEGRIVTEDLPGTLLAPDGSVNRMLYPLPLDAFPSAVGMLIGNSDDLDVFGALLFDESDTTLTPEVAGAHDLCRQGTSKRTNGITLAITAPCITTLPPLPESASSYSGLDHAPPSTATSALNRPALRILAPASGSRILW